MDLQSTRVSAVASLDGKSVKERIIAQLGKGPIKASLQRVFLGLEHYLNTGEPISDRQALKEQVRNA